MEQPELFVPYLAPGEFAAWGSPVGGAKALEPWWTEYPIGGEGAVVVLARVEREVEREAWARAVSAASGGFCVARGAPGAPPWVFLSGRRLRPGPGDTWEGCFEKLCGMRWFEDMAAPGVAAPFTPEEPPPGPEVSTRVGWVHVTGEELTRAAAQAAKEGLDVRGWRWLERRTPRAGLPCALLERHGPCDAALLEFLTRRVDGYGTAVELGPAAQGGWWWFAPTGEGLSERETGAAEVMAAWSELAVLVGEGGGFFRWPRAEAGSLLA
ncbi:MAG: hypothetical protein JXB05_01075 [Myxococcaceae bacterium]|nr:hypothetical protein [Myxococcaceae bacterium]